MRVLSTRGNNKFEFIVDDSDYNDVSLKPWYYLKGSTSRTSYIYTKNAKETIYLHRFLMKPNKGEIIDHINGNGLDNRRENLRICTHSQNKMNRQANTGRNFKGVTFDKKEKRRKKWRAFIVKNGKCKTIGHYFTEIEAANAYNNQATQLHGEYAKLNEVKND